MLTKTQTATCLRVLVTLSREERLCVMPPMPVPDCSTLLYISVHAVLLVHELVHLGTYLLDGGLHLLAVDVDGYPAGAALCHKR